MRKHFISCEGNKVFVKYQAQGGVNPNPPLAYALVHMPDWKFSEGGR